MLSSISNAIFVFQQVQVITIVQSTDLNPFKIPCIEPLKSNAIVQMKTWSNLHEEI